MFHLTFSFLIFVSNIIYCSMCSYVCNYFLYARHLTDVLWYGAVRPSVRPSVRSVVHNPCGQDIARTILPRMLKLSMYT